jgi:outer membrane protein W
MKKLIVSLTIMLALSYSSFAQSGGAYSEGSNTISLGYGIGNIWKTLFSLDGEAVSATGPFALTFEHGFTEKISAGLSVGYSKVTGTGGDDNGSGFTESLTNFAIVARGNYHFGESEKFDPYIGLGLGYYNFKYTNSDGDNSTFAVPGALAISAQLGAKYYFSPQIGAYAEVGYVAGSILQIGVTYKLAGSSN